MMWHQVSIFSIQMNCPVAPDLSNSVYLYPSIDHSVLPLHYVFKLQMIPLLAVWRTEFNS